MARLGATYRRGKSYRTRMKVVSRVPAGAASRCVALESTLLVHGIPKGDAPALASELSGIVSSLGAVPLIAGVVAGVPVMGLDESELRELLTAWHVPKANTANLGVLCHRRSHAATTVSATMELAAAAGVSLFATGGLGGVHKGWGEVFDVSSDLAAFTRFPVAVVTSGVKSILDVESTREALETLGVPVVGFRCDRFPAFYRRESDARVDARFDEVSDLATFLRAELARTRRGVVVCNPVPAHAELSASDWAKWLQQAELRAAGSGARGRDLTPAVLGALHEVSGGATLRANLELVRDNTRLGAELAMAWPTT